MRKVRVSTFPLRTALGLVLCGYGVLVLIGVMPHDALWAGAASLVCGAALLFAGRSKASSLPARATGKSRIVASLGAMLVASVLLYNLMQASSLSAPEVGMLAYGAALVAAAPWLHRKVGSTDVGTVVAWSFPILLAPLAIFALNALLSSGTGATAASPLVQVFVVHPAAFLVRLSGLPVELSGSTMFVPTPRGTLSLGVGLVCAGLYPIVLFAGLVTMHAWTERTSPKRAALLVAAGVAGLWAMNLLRLVMLARVGVAWGPAALQSTHANLGWILFALYMALFWAIALRRPKETAPPPSRPPA